MNNGQSLHCALNFFPCSLTKDIFSSILSFFSSYLLNHSPIRMMTMMMTTNTTVFTTCGRNTLKMAPNDPHLLIFTALCNHLFLRRRSVTCSSSIQHGKGDGMLLPFPYGQDSFVYFYFLATKFVQWLPHPTCGMNLQL